MKQKIIFCLFALLPFLVQAQVDGFLNKVKNKTTTRINNKIDRSVDRGLDKLEGKISSDKAIASNPSTQTILSDTGNKVFVKYDFIPGEKIIYSNDFALDNLGELPTGWNSNGSAAVVNLENLTGNWVQFNQNSVYLTDNQASFSENFTVEFDLILRRSNPKFPFPEFVWGVLSSGSLATTHNDLLKGYASTFATEMSLQPADNSNSFIQLKSYSNHSEYFKTDLKKAGTLLQQYNKVIHVAMQVQKERLRIWFDSEKLYDLPKAIAAGVNINQLFFIVKRYGGPDDEVGYALSNIKIALGLADTRNKLLNEGRFSTTGIVFDVNSYSLLPKSNGILSEIGNLLIRNPELKIKVIGHTDNDGKNADNLALSKKRAAAVKESLVKNFNIDASRIESDGKGEEDPVSDNSTPAGKGNNRRVEFIKQ